MSDDTQVFLSNLPLFNNLNAENLAQICRSASILKVTTGQIISVQAQTEIDSVYIVKQGTLELFYEKDGTEILSGLLKIGDIFGGISILMNAGVSVRTVRAERDSTLLVIPKKLFLDICARDESFYEYFVNIFSQRMLNESYASMVVAGQAHNFIRGIVPFSFLPDDAFELITGEISIVHYPKDTILFKQGQSTVDHLYIIQKGAAERYFEDNRKKMLRGMLGEGDLYGGISMLLNDGISVRTLLIHEDTYFYTIPKQIFIDLCNRFVTFSDYFTNTFGKRMLDRTYAEIIATRAQSTEDNLKFLNQSVASLCNTNLVYCGQDVSIKEAAAIMSQNRCSSIFVKDHADEFIGVVTDNDLRSKVIAQGFEIAKPVSKIMSTPLKSISSDAMVFEALMLMMQQKIKHLAVVDANDHISGIITNQDLLTAQGQSPVFLIREIAAVERLEDLFSKHQQLPQIVRGLINSGAKAQNVTRMITTISDAILEKLIQFALDEMGPPPVRFVFMIMGSEGRKEQTLKTDQDNAIIYDDVSAKIEKEVHAYFLSFGEKVCGWLDQAGYSFCNGGIMAQNPKWCQPLTQWKNQFDAWIHTAEPEDLFHSSIFFDFRGAYGNLEIIDELRQFLFSTLVGWSGFFRHLTENAMHFKPPLGFFRNFLVESKGEHRNAFDIKGAMVPIVDFARIYALKNSLEETNTLERLNQLHLNKVLKEEEYNEIEQAYSFLMQLRFVRQITAIMDDGAPPDNYINPKKLTRIEQTMLKEIFKRIEKFQSKLEFEFTSFL